ncbi:hypothetical protein [Lentibacillus sediminis]|uniref:hypothetical protein n=1 Tax=Lentibacillus sediminis TaxID=1940529 RepID=UPI000C1C8240|nr:hypothetical protein [Lentibacillus sediminis]
MEIVALIAAIVGLITALVNLTITLLSTKRKKTIALDSDSLHLARARELISLVLHIVLSL